MFTRVALAALLVVLAPHPRLRLGPGRARRGPHRPPVRLGCRRARCVRLLGSDAVHLREDRHRPAASRDRSVARRRAHRPTAGAWRSGFFSDDTRRSMVTHVGIYEDDGVMINASSRAGRVRRDDLDDEFWAERFMFARRITGAAGTPQARRSDHTSCTGKQGADRRARAGADRRDPDTAPRMSESFPRRPKMSDPLASINWGGCARPLAHLDSVH